MANRKQPELPEEKWPELRRAKGRSNTYLAYFTDLIKLLYKELDEEKANDIVDKFMAANAEKYAQPGMKMFSIEGNDPWAVASYFKLATGDILGYKAELIQEAPNRVIYRLYPPCLWFPELDIPESFCVTANAFERKVVEIMNPKIKTYVRSLLTRGDPYCEVVFEETE